MIRPFLKRRFWNRVYVKNLFGGTESKSGEGSSPLATVALRKSLERIIERFEIESIVDVPCGDFAWMRLVNLSTIEYLGLDISSKLISSLKSEFPDRSFRTFDITKSIPPKADLILVRDLLPHLTLEDCQSVLANIHKSSSRYLLITTFLKCPINIDFKDNYLGSVQWRTLNMKLPPFSLGDPLEIYLESSPVNGIYQDKALALYDLYETKREMQAPNYS